MVEISETSNSPSPLYTKFDKQNQNETNTTNTDEIPHTKDTHEIPQEKNANSETQVCEELKKLIEKRQILSELKEIATENQDNPLTKVFSSKKPFSQEMQQKVRQLVNNLGNDSTNQSVGQITPASILALVESEEKKLELKGSQDLGGHGGTFTAKVTIEGNPHYLFLKPKDDVEAMNYQIIQKLAPELSKWMPKIYGETEIGRQKYLVMENTRIDKNEKELIQLADIKLAGKVQGLDNPIASQNEMQTTRGQKKSPATYTQMKIGAETAPNFMIASGPKKWLRIFNYKDSKINLLKALDNKNHEKKIELIKKLIEIMKDLEQAPIALIGASIILIEDSEGNIKPLIIDPAHMVVDPQQKNNLKKDVPTCTEDRNKVFYGTNTEFKLQKESNNVSMKAIQTSVSTNIINELQRKFIHQSTNSKGKKQNPKDDQQWSSSIFSV